MNFLRFANVIRNRQQNYLLPYAHIINKTGGNLHRPYKCFVKLLNLIT